MAAAAIETKNLTKDYPFGFLHLINKAEVGIRDYKVTMVQLFVSSRRRHTRLQGDWSSDVCSSDLSISPFKEVYLKDLKVKPIGQETLVTAPEVRVRYKLMDIIRGNIDVDEITLASPTITLVENPDGTSNLDPITQSQKEKSKAEKKEEKKSSKPTHLDLKKFALTEATI